VGIRRAESGRLARWRRSVAVRHGWDVPVVVAALLDSAELTHS